MGVYGSIGLSFTSITMDEMMVRTVQDPEPNGIAKNLMLVIYQWALLAKS